MKKLIFPLMLLFVDTLYASEEKLQEIDVTTEAEGPSIAENSSLSKVSGDSARLLEMTPGMSFQKGGGMSSLPVLQGLADDRINIKVDGANITSSCSNHMNPSLSYIDPTKVKSIKVFAAVTPVSYGGDSLAGSIIVESLAPRFAETPDEIEQHLTLKSFFKSNNENRGASLNYSIASEKNYVAYSGYDEAANNLRTGKGDRLKSTLYVQNNQSLTIGRKVTHGTVAMKVNHARVPKQGFVNQYMDMDDNSSTLVNLGYKGTYDKFHIDSSVYYQHTNHLMDILQSERSGSMPMYTRSDEYGYNLKADLDISSNHVLTFGSDFNRYRLNDWWPPVDGATMMMGPGTHESIKNGERDRLGLFVEGESNWSKTFSTNIGLRADTVWMDTGDVKGYNSTDNLPADAAFFNAQSHRKRDQNYDATLISNLELSKTFDLGLGFARKTRSPNLYERYAWAGLVTDPTTGSMSAMSAGMDMRMINWFGDGNGYVGNIDLAPEIAHKVFTSFNFHDEDKKSWNVKLTPFFSDIEGFIDADFIGSAMGANYLRFANHDAVIFGADLSSEWRAVDQSHFGSLTFKGIASYTRGYRKDGKADLYHIMPLNGKFAVEHEIGKWKNEFIAHLVDDKEQVNDLRSEPKTPGYAIFDVGTKYQFSKLLRVDFLISNILDQHYSLPLGGVDLVNFDKASRTPVGGMGRSYNMAVTLDFF